MPHLVEPFRNVSFSEALRDLREAHDFLVSRAVDEISNLDFGTSYWGTSVKRLVVRFTVPSPEGIPCRIGKQEEKFGEVVNMAATVERLIDTIEWFSVQPESKDYSIGECHPSTSNDLNGNDLVIVDPNKKITIRCEVCDVASSNAGSNKKEAKDIRSLGCNDSVPLDGVDRYISTSKEFAIALASPQRQWAEKPYRYNLIETNKNSGTCLLSIVPAKSEARLGL